VSDLAERFERCVRDGGVALFPSDTVYGLACDPCNEAAIARLYEIKRRPPDKAAAVMFFELDAALEALPELGPHTREALGRLMPGGVTALLPNPAGRFPLACRADPSTLGLRVVSVPALAGVRVAVLQSSANLSGGRDARRLADVDPQVRARVDLEIDGGELPGVASTVVDLRDYERGLGQGWRVIRPGAVAHERLAAALDGQYHFNPETYEREIRADLRCYEELQEQVVAAGGGDAELILELGTGTGETAARLLERHPRARLVGIDESPAMLARAARRLPPERVRLQTRRLQDPLPQGRFDLVASALSVHHLDADEKRSLFARVREALAPSGRFVLGDVVLVDPDRQRAELTHGYDKPSGVREQLRWLREAGLADPALTWSADDLAVMIAFAPR